MGGFPLDSLSFCVLSCFPFAASVQTDPKRKSRATAKTGASAMTGKTARSGASSRAPGVAAKVAEMKQKTVSVAYFNVRDWLNSTEKKSDASLTSLHASIAETISGAIDAFKGVPDMTGDRFFGAFNAFKPSGDHRRGCVRAALQAREAMERKDLTVTSACSSGSSRVGSIGCVGLKKMSIASALPSWVVAAERVSASDHLLGVVDSFIQKEVGTSFVLRAYCACAFKKLTTKRSICLYEVLGEVESAEDEWMYQLEDAEKGDVYLHWNLCMEAAAADKWGEAEAAWEKCKDMTEKQVSFEKKQVLCTAVATKNYKALEILYH
eukprot:Hpha_TRINITY_DN22508_c0_g1::TRINITY_DN22508_c0_g1_i1::g.185167::m.185167